MSPAEKQIRADVLQLLRTLEEQVDQGDAQEEHVIVVCDPQTRREHAIGVYQDRAAALAGLAREKADYLKADPEFADLAYRVIPMFRGLHEKDSR